MRPSERSHFPPSYDGSHVKVVAEYERAVIFRLGRLKKGGSLGPGLHFEIPCVEHAEVVDMRTSKMKVPPQEVLIWLVSNSLIKDLLSTVDPDQGLSDSVSGRRGVLPGVQRHHLRGQRGGLPPLHQAAGPDYLEECPGYQEPA